MADRLLKNGCTENLVQKTDGAFFSTYLNCPPVEDWRRYCRANEEMKSRIKASRTTGGGSWEAPLYIGK
jgi:hypothetical protein